MAESHRYVVNINQRNGTSIIESKGNANYKEPMMNTEKIAKYVEMHIGARFSELLADYIKYLSYLSLTPLL